MDRTLDYGSCDVGSIPTEGTKKQNGGELLKKRRGALLKIVGTYGVDGEVLTKK